MFWIICFVVFAALLAGIGYALSRGRRSSGLGDDNRDALNNAAARTYSRRNEGGFGGGGF